MKSIYEKLNSVGNGFCLAKWTNSTIHLGLGKTHSCHHCGSHNIPLNEIAINVSALHNTAHKKHQRQLMLTGERPNECDYCWKIEDNSNSYSDRVLMSSKEDSWPYFNKIKNTDIFDPTYLEISFSNVCNMKCGYCGPSFSSQWQSEIEKYGAYPTSIAYNNIVDTHLKEKDNPYIDAFWKYLPTIYHQLHTLRVTGGEPLLSKNTFKLLNYIKEHPNKNMTLTINSNLNVDQEIVDNFISLCKDLPVKKIVVATSNEASKQRAEYIRDGLNYDTWFSNCKRLLDSTAHLRLDLMCAYNVLSVTSFTEFLKDIKSLKDKYNRVMISIAYVRDPKFLEVSILPRSWKHYLEESLDFLKNNFDNQETVNRFNHVLASFDAETTDITLKKDLIIFLNEYDQRRSKNFLKVFPEYQELLEYYSTL
jgi:organic radical activating enzyme